VRAASRRFGLGLALGWAALACHPGAGAGEGADPIVLERHEILAGSKVVEVGVAWTEAARRGALRGRPDPAVLLLFPEEVEQTLNVAGARGPLDAGLVDRAGRLVGIADVDPARGPAWTASKPAKHVLVLPRGWFAKNGVAVGSPVVLSERVRAFPPEPSVWLSTAKMHVGTKEITVELAYEDATRMRGLMYRNGLRPDHGMLFLFPDDYNQGFWMKSTYLPLSIAYIDGDGRIVKIADMHPLELQSVPTGQPVRYALEMEQGWFTRHGIEAGTTCAFSKEIRAVQPR
jgi:uncharacterized membrane protein (UPF0127 family)